MDHYANAFSAREGAYWRWIYERDGTGRPMSCPELVECRGRYRTRRGEWFVVDSCDGHLSDVPVGAKRIQGVIPDDSSSPTMGRP